MTVLAVTTSEVLVTLHILAVVFAFGGAAAYPLWFVIVRKGTPEQRAFFHRAQARLGQVLIVPGMVVIFVTGAWLTSDYDLWEAGWVLIPLGMLVLIALLGVGFLGPSEERLSRQAEKDDSREYEPLFRRVRAVTWVTLALVIASTFMMVARIPE